MFISMVITHTYKCNLFVHTAQLQLLSLQYTANEHLLKETALFF